MKPIAWAALAALAAGAVGVVVVVARRDTTRAAGTTPPTRFAALTNPIRFTVGPSADVQALRTGLVGLGGVPVPTNIPPPPGSTLPVNRESEREWEELRERYSKVPVIGPMYAEFLGAVGEAFGFAESTAARDLDDMKRYDAWYAAIREQDARTFAAVQAFAARIGELFGPLPVLRVAIATDEHVTPQAILTGVPEHLGHPWFTAEGWREWYDLLWRTTDPLPLPQKGWKKYQTALGNTLQRILELRALGAIKRFNRILEEFAG